MYNKIKNESFYNKTIIFQIGRLCDKGNKTVSNEKEVRFENTFPNKECFIFFKKHTKLAFEAHFHERFELLYILDGECEAVINGDAYNAKKNDIVIVNKFESHFYRQLSKTIEAFVLVVDDFFLSSFYTEYGGKVFSHILRYEEKSAEIKLLLEKWFRRGTDSVVFNTGCFNLLLSLLAECDMLCNKPDIAFNYINAITYINEHYMENITMQSVAKKMGYSEVYFSSRFNKMVGMNFRAYLNLIRIKKAKEMLSDGNKTIEEVALKVGFNNMATYYRALKRTGE